MFLCFAVYIFSYNQVVLITASNLTHTISFSISNSFGTNCITLSLSLSLTPRRCVHLDWCLANTGRTVEATVVSEKNLHEHEDKQDTRLIDTQRVISYHLVWGRSQLLWDLVSQLFLY